MYKRFHFIKATLGVVSGSAESEVYLGDRIFTQFFGHFGTVLFGYFHVAARFAQSVRCSL